MCTITNEEIDADEAFRRDFERQQAEAIASHAIINAKRPEWAQALIVAELHEDDSDSQSDYYGHKRKRTVAIGWRKGKREDFRQLRAAAATFPQTEHLGPGREDLTVYRKNEDGYITERFYFSRLEDAAAKADAIRAEGDTASIASESVEHRENYSMGGGNYIKSGSRHGNGWCVRSLEGGFGSLVIEDALPETKAPAPPTSKRESNTVRRDQLKRLAEAGRLVLVDSYHYDEMLGERRGTEEIPVRVRANHDDWKPGFCNLWQHDFTGNSGHARRNENGTITLRVHSNCNYTFRVLDEAPASVQPEPQPAIEPVQESAPLAIYTPEPSEPAALTVVSPEVESEPEAQERPAVLLDDGESLGELIPHITATKLATVYQKTTARIRELLVELGNETAELREAFALTNTYSSRFDVNIEIDGRRESVGPEAATTVLAAFKRNAWEALIEKLDIRKVMSSKRQEEMRNYLHGNRRWNEPKEDPLPDITEESIMQVIGGMAQSAPEFLAESIAEEYDFLRPRRDGYKTNKHDRVGRKVIIGWAVDTGWDTSWRPNYHRESHLRSIDWIFHSLAGKGIPRDHDGPLCTAIKSCGPDGVGETDLFRFKCYHNHNLHLEFKRLDLLDEFNLIAGRRDRVGAGR